MAYSIYSSYKNKSNRLETRPLPPLRFIQNSITCCSNIAELIQTRPKPRTPSHLPREGEKARRIGIPTRRHPLVDILKMLPIRGIALFHESASQI